MSKQTELAQVADTITVDSGNVGIGTSSPAGTLQLQDATAKIQLTNDANTGSAEMAFRTTTGSNRGFVAYNFDSDYMNFRTGGSGEAMRIDSSGNVGIGVVPETWNSANNGLQVGPRAAIFGTDSGYSGFSNNQYQATDGSAKYIVTAPAAIINLDPDSTIKFRQAASGTADTAISWSETMRLDASGNLLMGTASVLDSGGENAINVLGSTTLPRWCMITKSHSRGRVHYHTSSGGISDYFIVGSTNVGAISQNTTSTTYATSSDHRLKTDAQPMTGATDRLKQLNPVNFEWIADGTRVDGFLAHEAQAVVPEAVTGTKDAMRDEEYEVTPAVLDDGGNVVTEAVMGTRSVPDYQGIDQSKLVPLLTAALQEALTEITDLKARVAALETP